MCEPFMDSGRFQADDDIGYCFDHYRQTQEWKDKVLENVKTNEAAKINSDNIKNTFQYLLTVTELWEIPWNDWSGTCDEHDYNWVWNSGREHWVNETFKKAEPYFKDFYEWGDVPDEEHVVRVMVYLLNIKNIW